MDEALREGNALQPVPEPGHLSRDPARERRVPAAGALEHDAIGRVAVPDALRIVGDELDLEAARELALRERRDDRVSLRKRLPAPREPERELVRVASERGVAGRQGRL